MKFIKILLINIIILFVVLEAASFLYFKLGLSISTYQPSYMSKAHDSESQWMTEYNNWGAWHKINGRAHKERRCFGVDLIANSYGARDKERVKNAENDRVIVLGDSFVEGYGVSADKRFTDLLEKHSNVEYLNFGASGDFGPAQYAVLYKELAKQFSHDQVLIAVLPDNDFTDNDPAVWQQHDKKGYQLRYRPYWKKSETGFELFYPATKPQNEVTFASYTKTVIKESQLKSKLQRLLWSYGVYRELRYISRGATLKAGTYSGYFDATQEQIDATKFFIKEIQKQAEGRKVSFFTIPRLSDLKRLSTEKSDMVTQFTTFAIKNDLGYVDLAPYMQKSVEDTFSLFLPCDGHWSEFGHKVAADILKKELNLP
ncbi:MAG: SGNH/GDSL hydrolase family protein [Methylocystaceae bacterium]|nr:SGNH/GDSL hydrolase family protein [Methylocystaceae bacterium]